MSEQKRREGAERIFQALSGVDEELLERSERKERTEIVKGGKHHSRKVINFAPYTGILAACICLCVVGGVLMKNGMISLTGSKKESAAAMDIAEMAPQMVEDAAEDRKNGVESAANAEMTTAGAAGDFETENADTMALEGAVLAADAGDGSAGKTTDDEEGKNSTVSKQQGAQQDMATYEEGVECRQITEEQARAVEKLGAHLPTVLPEGFVFAEAHCTENTGIPVALDVSWEKGENRIVLGILSADSFNLEQECMADPARPETYDVNRYSMPYDQSVPEAYDAIFDNPIFKRSDLSEDVIQARLKKTENTKDGSADVEVLGGNFRVLYEDGTMVTFNGCGSAKEVYQMFLSMEKTK